MMKQRILQMALVLFALSMVWGGGESAWGEEATEWLKTELFFGANLPGGQQIEKSAWTDFMDEVLTPRFPKGLTVYDAYGQMQHGDGRIEKQATWVVVILHPKDSVVDPAIQEVINAFRSRLGKAQVVKLTTPVLSTQFYAD